MAGHDHLHGGVGNMLRERSEEWKKGNGHRVSPERGGRPGLSRWGLCRKTEELRLPRETGEIVSKRA